MITAVNGEEALRTARDRMPDLAVLDVTMPKLSGVEVSRLLRSAPETRSMRVILMSAGLTNLILPDDADAFVAKPFGAMEIPVLGREVLSRPPREAAVPEPA